MRLKTHHGTYVVTGRSGKLLHLPEPSDQAFRSILSGSPLPVPASGLTEATIIDGPLAPSTLVVQPDGLVAFRRDGLFLCADRENPELRFDRTHVGGWECFAVTKMDGTVVPHESAELINYAPSLPRPVLIDTLAGYQIVSDVAGSEPVSITWSDLANENVSRHSLLDGSWIVDVDSTPDANEPFLIYWFYPFNTRIHVWRLDRSGRRLVGYDLSDAQAWSFLLGRRALGPAFTARLYLLSQKAGEWGAPALLSGDLVAAAEGGSVEALHAVLRYPLYLPAATVRNLAARAFHVLRAANRARTVDEDAHLKRFAVDALSEALLLLDPALRGLNENEVQSELDYRDVFADSKLLPKGLNAVPATLHRQTLEGLALILGGAATYESICILLRPNIKAVEFHYVHSSGVRHRIMDGIRYAYNVLSLSERDIWPRLLALGHADRTWTIRFEVGDLPSKQGPCVAFERLVEDGNSALVPDLYYFAFKGFTRGWFGGSIPSWTEKATRFVWRGSTTGAGALTVETAAQASRVRLCELGRALGAIADFGITDVVQARSEADADNIKTFLEERNLLRERMPQHVMGGFKFLLEIDGNANSWGFFAKLLMGCCILKVDSPFEQWYYKRLQPWVHYVPVANNLSDLSDRVQWCLQNEENCRKIADAGRGFAESLSFDTEISDAAQTFLSAALLNEL